MLNTGVKRVFQIWVPIESRPMRKLRAREFPKILRKDPEWKSSYSSNANMTIVIASVALHYVAGTDVGVLSHIV